MKTTSGVCPEKVGIHTTWDIVKQTRDGHKDCMIPSSSSSSRSKVAPICCRSVPDLDRQAPITHNSTTRGSDPAIERTKIFLYGYLLSTNFCWFISGCCYRVPFKNVFCRSQAFEWWKWNAFHAHRRREESSMLWILTVEFVWVSYWFYVKK